MAALAALVAISPSLLAKDCASKKDSAAACASGKELSIKVESGSVTVDNAKVAKTDVAANNGVIHVIDTVVLPN